MRDASRAPVYVGIPCAASTRSARASPPRGSPARCVCFPVARGGASALSTRLGLVSTSRSALTSPMTRGGPERVPHSQTLPDSDRYLNGLMQRFPLFKIYSRSSAEQKREYRSDLAAKSAAGSAMMPGQIPDPSLTTGSLPSLGPLAGISATTLTDQLKFADLRNLGAMLSPLHFLGRLGKRPAPLKTEMDEEEERRKRRREKNKVAAARCRNKKKERTEFLQRESERLEVMNSELKAQIEELKNERQQLIVMLNRHRPTCIVRTDSVKTPDGEANPLLEQLGVQ